MLNIKCISDFNESEYLANQDIVFYSGYIKTIDLESESLGETREIEKYAKCVENIKGIVLIRCITVLLGRKYQSVLVFNNGKFISIVDRIISSNEIDGVSNLVVFEKDSYKFVVVVGSDIKNIDLMRIIALQKVDFIVNICYNARKVNEYLDFYDCIFKAMIIQANSKGLYAKNLNLKCETKSLVLAPRGRKNNFVLNTATIRTLLKSER